MFKAVAQDIALDDQHQANHYRSHCSACCYNRVGGTNKQVALHANGGGGSDLLGRGPHPPPASWSRGPSLGLCVCALCVPCVCCVCPVRPEVPTCGLQHRRQYGFSYPAFTCRFTDTPCSVPFSIRAQRQEGSKCCIF